MAEERLRAARGRALPGGEETAVCFAQHGDVARGAAALRGDEERFETAEAIQGGKFTVEAVGQSAQFLAGVSTWPVDRLFVCVELAQAFGAVVEIER